MTETACTDADTENIVVFISCQTLLSVDGDARAGNINRCVPVEGHYAVVARPWAPQGVCEVLYDKGFVHSPAERLFPGTHECKKEWIHRLKMCHGIAPGEPLQTVKRLVACDDVRKARRYFLEAGNMVTDSMILVSKEKNCLKEQLEDMLDVVWRFRRSHEAAGAEPTLVFITLRERLQMVRATLRWLVNEGAELGRYTVVAIEDWIPSVGVLLDIDTDLVRHRPSNRCLVHPASYNNTCGRPHDCCRADVALLRLVQEHLADYLTEQDAVC
ncbi:hypothetical protein DQ04_02451060 [Trypanosoma grayi]|uniref:hypothetical protein n=1 Tax=Trypanosoma grayi TaxID=71804 RepID=UPI0004F45D41|nr:hypothetical protein DQ04_02451060 [Trypanosoma grayi]KEG11604.1 hypothetical protein DQ04_02451060 [Trypanosoma grayi]